MNNDNLTFKLSALIILVFLLFTSCDIVDKGSDSNPKCGSRKNKTFFVASGAITYDLYSYIGDKTYLKFKPSGLLADFCIYEHAKATYTIDMISPDSTCPIQGLEFRAYAYPGIGYELPAQNWKADPSIKGQCLYFSRNNDIGLKILEGSIFILMDFGFEVLFPKVGNTGDPLVDELLDIEWFEDRFLRAEVFIEYNDPL